MQKESKEKLGSLSDRQIKKILNKIFDKKTLKYISISPASIDLASTTEMYRIEKNIVPNENEKISDLLDKMGATKHDIKYPLEKDVQYICKVGKINLPKNLYAYGNAKSSSGRVDVHVRLLSDYTHSYDTITPGEKEIWLHISPHSFTVICPDNTPLLQVRIFNGDGRIKVGEVKELNTKQKKAQKFFGYEKKNEISKKVSWENASKLSGRDIILSLNVPKKSVVGYVAKKTNKIINLGKLDHNGSDFFEPIFSNDGQIYLEKDKFYILSTREYINIPEYLAGEMIANDPRLGEFRTHYAGFFDPGFSGEGVLEVRPQENITFWHGQPMVPFRLEYVSEVPEKSYKVGHNYFGQRGPRLAKFFKQKKNNFAKNKIK
jgi:dCTP deaminase